MSSAIEQLKLLLETGTEEEVNLFIAQHFQEFPEDVRKEIGVALFKEALQHESGARAAILEMKKEAVEMIDQLKETETEGTSNPA